MNFYFCAFESPYMKMTPRPTPTPPNRRLNLTVEVKYNIRKNSGTHIVNANMYCMHAVHTLFLNIRMLVFPARLNVLIFLLILA